MNTTKITFGMLNVVAASMFVANLHILKVPVPGITSFDLTAKDKGPGQKEATSMIYLDKINIVFPKKEEPQPDLFKKQKDIITFNTNPTPGIVFRVQVMATKT